MRNTLRHIRRGAGYLPCCGDHPGTPLLLGIVALNATTGAATGGWPGAAFGAFVALVVFVPIWAIGAVERSKSQDEVGE
ncbi:MAG: hypothetical protein FKY71_20125 [Spiribacter salinus]|uniref:Uncharacterized protein n=1 Tax=Spiribacter salinus TaxID=1335746 RepID=A0A540V4M2_9GAMM|nr:MAG: hypothetical protein FKY71_20125 [Spiribacter salinus]